MCIIIKRTMAAVKYGDGRIISSKEILSEKLMESETWEKMCFSEMTPNIKDPALQECFKNNPVHFLESESRSQWIQNSWLNLKKACQFTIATCKHSETEQVCNEERENNCGQTHGDYKGAEILKMVNSFNKHCTWR